MLSVPYNTNMAGNYLLAAVAAGNMGSAIADEDGEKGCAALPNLLVSGLRLKLFSVKVTLK